MQESGYAAGFSTFLGDPVSLLKAHERIVATQGVVKKSLLVMFMRV